MRRGTWCRRAVVACAAAAALLVPAGEAWSTLAATDHRLAGADRFATARAVALDTFDAAPVALLASGRAYPDALGASYLSGGLNAPLLLTEPNALPEGTTGALERLGTERVIVIGGAGAVSDAVLEQLQRSGFEVSRIGGENRYATARVVAGAFASSSIGELDGGRAAIVVTGEGFADALAVAPVSSSEGVPILLTPTSSLHAETRTALQQLEIERVLVVGGTAAVSDAVVGQIQASGIRARRIAGADRQATALLVAAMGAEDLGYAMDRVLLARGDSFADALAAGTRGGWLDAPVLLVRSRDALGTDARAFIRSHVDTVTSVDVLGGPGVISDAVADDAVEAAKGR